MTRTCRVSRSMPALTSGEIGSEENPHLIAGMFIKPSVVKKMYTAARKALVRTAEGCGAWLGVQANDRPNTVQ